MLIQYLFVAKRYKDLKKVARQNYLVVKLETIRYFNLYLTYVRVYKLKYVSYLFFRVSCVVWSQKSVAIFF